MSEPMFPVQTQAIQIPEWLQREAYETYTEYNGDQESLLTPSTCRGGFSTIELIAFLYARQFATKAERAAAVKRVFSGVKRVR